MTDDADIEPRRSVRLEQLRRGDHLCAFYSDESELARVAGSFVRVGLATGDRVLYVASDRSIAGVQESLEQIGIATDDPLRSSQLVLQSFGQLYANATHLELHELDSGLRLAAREARSAGFPALRVAAEMGDFARALGSLEDLLNWERLSSKARHEEGFSSVCQYDQRSYDEEAALRIAGEHTGELDDIDPPSALASFFATESPYGLRVVGELDLSNRDQFARALEARVAAREHVTIDLSRLYFIDLSTVDVIYACAERLPRGGSILMLNASAHLRRIIEVAGLSHPGVLIEP